MSEGEEEADAERLFAFLDKEAGGVVYGGNVISVEGMAESQAVCECPLIPPSRERPARKTETVPTRRRG